MKTPLHLELMIWYHTRCMVDFEAGRGRFFAPGVVEALKELCRSDMLRSSDGTIPMPPSVYSITDKGRAYVNFLCEMPEPVYTWTLPR